MNERDVALYRNCREFIQLHKLTVQSAMYNQNLYFGQHMLLLQLREAGGCTQKELAHMLMVSTATITVALKRLEKSGLIKKIADERDSRCNRLELTERGLTVCSECTNVFRKINTDMFAGFTRKEKDQLTSYFQRIGNNLRSRNGCLGSTSPKKTRKED